MTLHIARTNDAWQVLRGSVVVEQFRIDDQRPEDARSHAERAMNRERYIDALETIIQETLGLPGAALMLQDVRARIEARKNL